MKIDFFNKTYKRKLVHVLISQMTKKNKYQQFKMVEESYFLSESDKRNFFIYYRKNIGIYLLFIKMLSKKYENQQKLKFDNNFDLSLNPLRYRSTISLFHCNKRYDFDIFDLLKMIKNALYYNDNLFIQSQYPKNPYNNEAFTIGNFMNIYFYMRSKNMNIPSYFEDFRRCGFCLDKYIEINEPRIKLNCIKNYCESMTNDELYGEIIIMLRSYGLKNAVIHPDFPRDLVVKQFKSYIKNYFVHCYSHHSLLRAKYKIINKKKIKAFFKENPIFGRIIYTRNNPLVRSSNKYKYLNYLSEDIPDYNYFEDIENFNNISEDDEELDDFNLNISPILGNREFRTLLNFSIDDDEDDEDEDHEDEEDNEEDDDEDDEEDNTENHNRVWERTLQNNEEGISIILQRLTPN